MQYDKTNNDLVSAFAVVREYDSALYARMQSDDWRVTVDAFKYLDALPADADVLLELSAMTQSWGTTLSDPIRITWLNASDINIWAHDHNVNAADFAAHVLVHEYRHVHQSLADHTNAEPPAYRAGSAFAAKLPAPDGPILKAMSDATLRHFYA